MASAYELRRGEITTYFDRTAAAAWEALTSDAPVGRIRATVRAGRARMLAAMLARLPRDMRGQSLLDAGCGTGGLALEAARRGAKVTAVDVSPRMIEIAVERAGPLARDIDFCVGDMLSPSLGAYDHVAAMDSLIHYSESDILAALAALAPRTRRRMLFTIAPRTPLLAVMHGVGRAFPKPSRAPQIHPIAPASLARAVASEPCLGDWEQAGSERIVSGFYTSELTELVRQ